ncbi:MAG: 3-deoxy-D-manno-octulosonic acid transferase [Opitutales bacterium]|nr:3-deoxy-D-manno-octulosonic acid transferase [Opitutales bacterium]
MIWGYRLIFLPAFVLAFPYYLRRMLRRGGYGQDMQHRWGCMPAVPPKGPRKRVWAHAVSVGELNAIRPLLEAMKAEMDVEIVLSTTTSTGYALAQSKMKELCLAISYFPIDFVLFSRRAWKQYDPDMVVLMEAELWPEHLHQAKRRGVPVYMINARLSDKSYRRYAKFGAISRRLLNKPDLILPSSEHDLERFAALGINRKKLSCTGNLKCDSPLPELPEAEKSQLRKELFGKSAKEALILMGSSTWPGEEVFLADLRQKAEADGMDIRLLLVPRHAERREELKTYLQRRNEAFQFRTEKPATVSEPLIYVADTTGELSRLTSIADVVFIGKSLPPNKGGQTPIEAVGMGIPSVMGPEMSNFKQITQEMLLSKAALQAKTQGEAELLLFKLLKDKTLRKKLGDAGKEWHERQRGAIGRTLENIRRHLNRL